jgi:HAD superfamily hydrolase (TIGR01509 family)
VTFEAILFDNDGVLVDTERLYLQATREVLAGAGVTLTDADYVELFLRSARGAWHLIEGPLDEAALAELRAARDRRYQELIASSDVAELLIPAAAAAVPRLARRYRLAIVTSSDPAPFALAHARTGLLPHFELVLTREHYANSKPDPEPYLTAVQRLRVAHERCLVIEDSERGLRAAKAAGLTCWLIPSALTRHGRFHDADAVLDDLAAACHRLLGPPSGS